MKPATSSSAGLTASSALRPGDPGRLGAHCTDDGVLFSVYSASAEGLTLCLFDADGVPSAQHDFADCADGVWHGFLPKADRGRAGLRYGFRAHGRFAPDEGLYFNSQRLLLDPYARAISGCYKPNPVNHLLPETAAFNVDNFASVPHGVVVGDLGASRSGVSTPEQMRVIYEAHAAGLTRLNPQVAEGLRGSFSGVAAPAVINHLRALGVTSLQLLPVHSYIDEPHLIANGLTNYWGYNTLNFFTPHGAYVAPCDKALGFDHARISFRQMVRALHDANIEVILDVVYNHTCEGGADGPVLSYRGLDNLTYYRTDPANRHAYINDTGCGNTLDFMNPVVQRLTLDSLRYFAQDMEVDGFRFDLAVSLGREPSGFNPRHELFEEIRKDPVLSRCALIAEPWDIGPGGYQTGGFSAPWMEWNDKYRDAVRSYWRGDKGAQAEISKRLHGSSDLFENGGRGVATSINFVTAHDGFTLADVVAYAERHNEANGEGNRDGHAHNLSDNMGMEGWVPEASKSSVASEIAEVDVAALSARRDRRSRAMLATLIFSQGTPMLLAGDELGNSQRGNNNAYCQDNPIGWVQWEGLATGHANLLQRCIDVRSTFDCFRVPYFVHAHWCSDAPFRIGTGGSDSSVHSITWLGENGRPMQEQDWQPDAAVGALPFALLLAGENELVLIALNPSQEDCHFTLPCAGVWQCWINSADPSGQATERFAETCELVPHQSLSVLSLTRDSANDTSTRDHNVATQSSSACVGNNE